jgi:MoxR-like ATPase
VLVTDFVDALSFEEVKRLPEAERDRFAEIQFRFFYGLVTREHIARATRTRATRCSPRTAASSSWTSASSAAWTRPTSRASASSPAR